LYPQLAHGAAPDPVASDAVFGRLASLRFPEKAQLIALTDRPPNLETPLRYFREDLTPNEAFYVRWHLGITPTRIDVAEYRLKLSGHVDRPIAFSLDDLRKNFEPTRAGGSGAGRGAL
jgi:DMSO/TMAO reductase YedYZ molybdopterin-dependent catalytic subunit